MNYKGALVPSKDTIKKEQTMTQLQPVIKYGEWEGKPGWVKIYSSMEPVAITTKRSNPISETNEKISLDDFVKLQERRMAEYDSNRWDGAFREMFPIYPPYPDCDNELESDDDGLYLSDNDGNYYSDPEY